jgi:hypothetical protein
MSGRRQCAVRAAGQPVSILWTVIPSVCGRTRAVASRSRAQAQSHSRARDRSTEDHARTTHGPQSEHAHIGTCAPPLGDRSQLSVWPAAEPLETDLAQLLMFRGSEALPGSLPAHAESLTDLVPCTSFGAGCPGCRSLHRIEVPLELGGRPKDFERIRLASVDQSIPSFPGREILAHAVRVT